MKHRMIYHHLNGGIVDHSSNFPNPRVLSSAEAKYNEGYLAFVSSSHLCMLIGEMEKFDKKEMQQT